MKNKVFYIAVILLGLAFIIPPFFADLVQQALFQHVPLKDVDEGLGAGNRLLFVILLWIALCFYASNRIITFVQFLLKRLTTNNYGNS